MTSEVKKRGLGRGLDALFMDAKSEEAAFEPKMRRGSELSVGLGEALASALTPQAPAAASYLTSASGTRKISVDRLKPGKFQPRRHFDDSAIESLAESIAVHGVLQPILVRPLSNGMYEIIAGERRWRAAQKAQVHDVPVVIQEMNDNDALEIALIENLQREDLTALEEAEGYQRLLTEFRHTQDVLAHHLGKSRSHVTNTLRLLKLSERVKRYIQEGALSAGHARALVGCTNADTIAEAIVKRGLSVRQTEALVKEAAEGKTTKLKTKKPVSRGFIPKDVDVLALEEKMTSLLGMKVTIDVNGAAGALRVEYKSLEQLDDVLERLSRTPKK